MVRCVIIPYSDRQIERREAKVLFQIYCELTSFQSKRGLCENLTEVFGGEPRFSYHWCLPVSVKFLGRSSRHIKRISELYEDKERIYGYKEVKFEAEIQMKEVKLEMAATSASSQAVSQSTRPSNGSKYNPVPTEESSIV